VTTAVRDDRASYRPYRVRVARIDRMTPHFARVTFTDPALADFGTDGLDQRIKLLFPVDGLLPDLGLDDPAALRAGDWYQRIRAMPTEHRPVFRTYTVRAVRPAEAELDVDFVDHGPLGPAGAWLADAEAGAELIIVGPTALSTRSAEGIDWHPGAATRVLLAGDETAAPAICAIVESLPDTVEARAFVEIPHAVDLLDVERRADDITWLMRGDAEHGHELRHAVRGWVAQHRDGILSALSATPEALDEVDIDAETLWDVGDGDGSGFYAWIAGEAGTVKDLRRFLVTDTGIHRSQVAFMGYWRTGRAEPQD
jgi:NADPH-dependent ferric siderophore reductase